MFKAVGIFMLVSLAVAAAHEVEANSVEEEEEAVVEGVLVAAVAAELVGEVDRGAEVEEEEVVMVVVEEVVMVVVGLVEREVEVEAGVRAEEEEVKRPDRRQHEIKFPCLSAFFSVLGAFSKSSSENSYWTEELPGKKSQDARVRWTVLGPRRLFMYFCLVTSSSPAHRCTSYLPDPAHRCSIKPALRPNVYPERHRIQKTTDPS
ncbi:hypothetical protein BSKO_13572 [Bryopsis sp. KO-2023]|nr:hypothetical protein BSKO_13572 [Bryopsis sp. KO-2023]